MNKFKISIFVSLALIFIGSIGYPFVKNIIKQINPTLFNSAVKITLHNGKYIVGKDIKPGFYDIEALNNNVIFNSIKMSKDEKFIGQELLKGSHIVIKGNNGEAIKFSPAKFDHLTLNKKNEYVIKHSGFYSIGRQIPKGKYKITYYSDNKDLIVGQKPFIQILNAYEENPIKSFQFENNKSYNVDLQKGSILEIHKNLFEENKYIKIKLIPLKDI